MMDETEIDRRLEECRRKAKVLAEIISDGVPVEAKETSTVMYGAIKVVERMYNSAFTQTKKFRATDECVGCGLCVKNCPLNNITLINQKPVWKGKCIHCMACINRCPKEAIEYGKGTVGKPRYVCREFKERTD